jgi:hypothetical protein
MGSSTSDTRSGAVNGARSDQGNISLDGIRVNDEGGHAFTSVLPMTLDSVQEFRVTTSNDNADQGETSGAAHLPPAPCCSFSLRLVFPSEKTYLS